MVPVDLARQTCTYNLNLCLTMLEMNNITIIQKNHKIIQDSIKIIDRLIKLIIFCKQQRLSLIRW
jgi:hypothetical protein